MHTQFHQPASGSQAWGRYLGGALVKNSTWPKGSGGRPSPVGLSSPGGPTFLMYLFSLHHQTIAPSRVHGNWQTMQRKPES